METHTITVSTCGGIEMKSKAKQFIEDKIKEQEEKDKRGHREVFMDVELGDEVL